MVEPRHKQLKISQVIGSQLPGSILLTRSNFHSSMDK